MNKTKRVLSVVLAVLMLSSLIAALAIAEGQYTVVINYVFQDGKQAASPWTATLAEGSSYSQTVVSPMVVGYEPDQASIDVAVSSITEDKTYTVKYKPAEVNFTVKHYLQNVDNDNYADPVVEITQGYTENAVGGCLAKSYTGFTALLYDTTTKIAADGSTVVEIYYDRNYYMMSFNLDGGFGVEPIYARFGAALEVGTPTKPGYTFSGWEPQVPATMPVNGGTYAAKWTKQDSKYQIQYWQENADDDGYSYVESETVNAATGDVVNYNGNKSYAGFTRNTDKTDKNVTVKGDGSTVLNVYFDREVYTIYFISDTETENVLSCDKEEHTHIYTGTYKKGNIIKKTTYYYGGCYPAGSNGSGGATKGNTICGKTEHSHNKRCYSEQDKVVATITAKYGAYIGDEWPTYNGSSTWATSNGGSTYQANIDTMPLGGATFYGPLTSSSSETAYYYVEVIPGEDGTEHGGILYKEHHRDTSAGSGFSITDEDEYPITGFTFKEVKTKSGSGNAYDGATFYYTRNRNNLVFDDQYGTKVYEQLPYEQVLSESVNYKNNHQPAYPSTLEDGAYVFGGWYLDPGCTQPVDWTAKMPDAQVVVYAKWAPKTHTVKTFLTKEKIEENNPIDTWDNVPHGTAVTNTPADPPNGSYVFVGWFYEENGVEKAFDFSMPVVKDLNLYAKWSSNTLVAYTIKYVLEKDGTTVIADETTGSALAGTTKTFDAKTGTDLYESYQSGYFPTTNSHSIDMKAGGDNTYTFKYVARDSVNYTVKYLEKGTNKVLHEEKHGSTKDAVITEKFEPISGYVPDALQKRLVLSANEEENVIEFLYTKDEGHALVEVIHWTQNAVGDGYTEYARRSYTGNINSFYSENPQSIEGYTYAKGTAAVAGIVTKEFTASEKLEAQLTDKGLTLNLYYDRVMIGYIVKHIDVDTGVEIVASEPGEARYGARVIGYAKNDIEGYMLTDGESQQKAIDITLNSADNVITFRYHKYYKIAHVQNYKVVGTDTIRLTGSKANLTAAVTPGFLYGGAFTTKDCDANSVQPFAKGETAMGFTPVKGETYYIWEVNDEYLRPSAYSTTRPDPTHEGKWNVVGLYLITTVDREKYQSVGFDIIDTNMLQANSAVYSKVKVRYNSAEGELYETLYTGTEHRLASVKGSGEISDKGIGYVAISESQTQVLQNANTSITYRPYWITLDGIRVTSAYDARTCTYLGAGEKSLNVPAPTKSTSSCTIAANASENTVLVQDTYLLSKPVDEATETPDVPVTPDVPETPVVPEVPEAPAMTLTGEAMFLRAQFTYDMMTNTAKFISAIDVNACTEYGFVINGETIKCEEAAETVDGYSAAYLFGESVNGAMLMSCNVLLDGFADGITINVTPYCIDLNGNVVYGETRTLVYRQWMGLEG